MNEIILDPSPPVWDAYVTECPGGLYSHLHGWAESLASTYDLRVFRLAAQRNGRLTGLVPLVLFSPPGAVRRLISLPYTDAAGIIADDDDSAAELLAAALILAVDLEADHLELRQADRGEALAVPVTGEWREHNRHCFKTGLARLLPLSAGFLWELLGAKVRNQVRKARKCGCRAEIGGSELLENFYAVFSENMRDLGSPVHSLGLYQQVVEKLPAKVFVVSIEGAAAAAAIVFQKGDTLFNPWASSLRRFRPLCSNMLLYWSMLSSGADTGCRRFDFGRSTPGAPTCRFKLQWGAEMEPLIWHVFSRGNSLWDPHRESLVDEEWKMLDLTAFCRQGPAVRRWISL